MVDLVRSAVTEQRERLKTVQHKVAIVEHLLLLSETICGKYEKMKTVYEGNTKKSAPTTPGVKKVDPSEHTAFAASNRTAMHFNKLIIDERRKLEALDKKIALERKKIGRLESHEYFEGEEGGDMPPPVTTSKMGTPKKQASTPMNTPVKTPTSSVKKGPRRASVSLRQALVVDTKPKKNTFKPSFHAITTLTEEDEEDEDGDGDAKVAEEEEEENPLTMTQQERNRRELFKQSEEDRLQLISENRRLRGEVGEVGARQLERMMEDLDPDLHSIVSDLNMWDCERDELDSEIDRLSHQKESLMQKLAATSRGAKMKNQLMIESDDDDSD